MPYRRILNPQPSPEAETDTPEMTESRAFIDSAEEDLRALSRLRQIAMEMAEAQCDYAKARLAAAASGDPPLRSGEEPTAAIDKIAQTVRRTVALKGKLASDVEKRRAGLAGERANLREQRTRDHERSVTKEIDSALTEAFTVMYGDGDDETDEGDALCREMLLDKENLLDASEAFDDYMARPVGETVALLCAELGLPDTCVRHGDTWRIVRAPSAFERFRDARDAQTSRAPAPVSSP
jgi:hypothetical protein